MDYLLILLADLGIAAQFCLSKLYQKRTLTAADGMRAYIRRSVFFSMISGLVGMVFFFCLSSFRLNLTPFSVVFAVSLALVSTTLQLTGIAMMSFGSVAVYTMFMMLGGMLLPFVAGIFFFGEQITPMRAVGLIVLCAALALSALGGSATETNARRKKAFYGFCTAVFVLNGAVSILSKTHQMSAQRMETNEFIVLSNLVGVIISAVIYLVVKAPNANVAEKGAWRNILIICIFSVTSGLAYMLQLIGAAHIDASVLYPMVTGGTIVLSTFAGWVFFSEKPGRRTLISSAAALAATIMFIF